MIYSSIKSKQQTSIRVSLMETRFLCDAITVQKWINFDPLLSSGH